MAYPDFKPRDLEEKFKIKYKAQHLFKDCSKKVLPTDWLKKAIQMAKILGLDNEKSRSERLVSPVLGEFSMLNKNIFKIYTGVALDVDRDKGLSGECDYVLSFSHLPNILKAPIFSIVEAKKHDLDAGVIQCSAQLIAAQLLNKKENPKFDKEIYGCSTSGVEWWFLKLKGNTITFDLNRYYIHNIEKLLGVLQCILDKSK